MLWFTQRPCQPVGRPVDRFGAALQRHLVVIGMAVGAARKGCIGDPVGLQARHVIGVAGAVDVDIEEHLSVPAHGDVTGGGKLSGSDIPAGDHVVFQRDALVPARARDDQALRGAVVVDGGTVAAAPENAVLRARREDGGGVHDAGHGACGDRVRHCTDLLPPKAHRADLNLDPGVGPVHRETTDCPLG